ncbi:hypothetical protein CLV92_101490 [Kineococcus xinjiangensis]|uniref:Phosphotransacetylase n=1 Tax=Kineococcus xinjiangensis TaxID=512762 RepID=A0A2S6IWP7_9ACTN|nr:hypothetical protein CLV92_101490 [Kineococcus xinjiangensis]
MSGQATCPRCDAAVRPPSIWRSSWSCAVHGDVVPLHPAHPADSEHLEWLAGCSDVPIWLPWPLPDGWLVTGVRTARDGRTERAQAVAMAISGPNPLRTPQSHQPVADALLVSEVPGVGLGAHLAGRADLDPGDGLLGGPPVAKLQAAGARAPLWEVDGHPGDRAVFVGEAGGVWLWVVLWPASASPVLDLDIDLVDVRDPGHTLDVPCGAMSPHLQWERQPQPSS